MVNRDVLTINPEVVCDLIDKTTEFQAKEEVSIPERSTETEYEYDWAQVLADHYDDLTYLEIKNVISSLPYRERLDLLTLLYVGRGDYTVDEWTEALEVATTNMPSNFTDYFLAHPFLSDYLNKALESLGYSCEEEEEKWPYSKG